jgi:hypothetical protein
MSVALNDSPIEVFYDMTVRMKLSMTVRLKLSMTGQHPQFSQPNILNILY